MFAHELRCQESRPFEAIKTVTIFVFGDHHARQAFSLCANVRLHWLGPYTMKRIGHGGAFKTLQIGMPKSGDTMIYMVGAEDIRRHIFRPSKWHNPDSVVATAQLAERFTDAVHGLTELLDPPVKVCIIGVMPPSEPQWDDSMTPAFGSFEQRRAAREALNAALAVRCRHFGASFVDIPKLYETKHGALRPGMSDGQGRLAIDHAHYLCEAVERAVGLDLGYSRPNRLLRLKRDYARSLAIRASDVASLRELGIVRQGQLKHNLDRAIVIAGKP